MNDWLFADPQEPLTGEAFFVNTILLITQQAHPPWLPSEEDLEQEVRVYPDGTV